MLSLGPLSSSFRGINNFRRLVQLFHHASRRSHFSARPEAWALSPRYVMITGGSRGIGLAIAQAFINNGDRVHIIARDSNRLSQIVQAWNEREVDSKHEFTAGDISDPKFWETLKHQGCTYPDVLINAAGISQEKIFLRQNADDIEKIIQTNLTGTIWACRQMSARMLQAHSGRRQHGRPRIKSDGDGESASEIPRTHCIINISSLLALRGGRGASVYAASKAGILGLTRALASELGPAGIRVNAIVPGYIDTDMTASFSKSLREKILERIPLSRFGTPDEVAQAALFLANNEYANNCVINLDGGLSAA